VRKKSSTKGLEMPPSAIEIAAIRQMSRALQPKKKSSRQRPASSRSAGSTRITAAPRTARPQSASIRTRSSRSHVWAM
jgi:hypothetical protein